MGGDSGRHFDKIEMGGGFLYSSRYAEAVEIVPIVFQDAPTVAELVKRHSGDMSPRSILDELIRVGAVRETDKGWFRVLRRE